MPRNGSGNYSLPTNAWNPAINGVSATPADWQALINDVAASIQASVSADGQTPITGNLQMGGHVLTGAGAPSGTGMSLRWEQLTRGADIPSATSITIPLEGQFFAVTGTTAITGFGATIAGRLVYIKFDAGIVLTNSASFILPGGANITTQADDIAVFLSISIGVWKCLFYTGTSPTNPTIGRVLKAGDWGIGGSMPVINGIDLLADDNYYEYYTTSALNAPAGAASTAGYVKKETRNSSYRKVTFTPYNGRGPWINVCNNGTWAGWVELYHSGNLANAFQGANQSLAASGYQKLPGGLIMQWGSVSVVENSATGAYYVGTASVVFPISFPNSAWLAFVTPRNTPNAVDAASYAGLSVTGMSIIGTTSNESPQTATISYLVIGN